MNKDYLPKILLLLLSSWMVACTELSSIYQPNTSPTSPSQKNEVVGNGVITIVPDFNTTYEIEDKFLSFNTGFMFTAPIEREPEVKKITQTLSPNTLRFPGGTVANYYHPQGKGYGFKVEEVKGGFTDITNAMPLFDRNAIEHFADLCKMSNTSVVYVANLLTGTLEETIWAIEYFKSQKIPVAGIELGNEYYLQQYREAFPTVQSYIDKAKIFAKELKKKYPNIPLGVVAANATEKNPKNNWGRFQNEWNRTLGNESFYDFYIPHLYTKVDNCENNSQQQIEKLFDCAAILMSPELYQYHQVVIDHYKIFFGNKKMWITEWNMDGSSNVSNTLLHASFTGEFLLGLLDASIKNPEIEYAHYHNYGSGGFTAPIFSYSNDTKFPYFKKVDKIAYNTSYFPFYYYKQLINLKAKRIQENITYSAGLSVKDVVVKTFISSDKKTIYLYYINKSNTNIRYDLKGAKEIQHMEGIKGDYPWSVGGVNGMKNKYPKHIHLIEQINFDKKTQDFTLPGNSIGYIAITL